MGMPVRVLVERVTRMVQESLWGTGSRLIKKPSCAWIFVQRPWGATMAATKQAETVMGTVAVVFTSGQSLRIMRRGFRRVPFDALMKKLRIDPTLIAITNITITTMDPVCRTKEDSKEDVGLGDTMRNVQVVVVVVVVDQGLGKNLVRPHHRRLLRRPLGDSLHPPNLQQNPRRQSHFKSLSARRQEKLLHLVQGRHRHYQWIPFYQSLLHRRLPHRRLPHQLLQPQLQQHQLQQHRLQQHHGLSHQPHPPDMSHRPHQHHGLLHQPMLLHDIQPR